MSEENDASEKDAALAVAILALRVRTPPGEWLSPEDFSLFSTLVGEATDAESLLLSMMNLAWYALMYLAATTPDERSEEEWLQVIAIDSMATPGRPIPMVRDRSRWFVTNS